MTTTDHNLGHLQHIDLGSSLRLRLSTSFGVTLSSPKAPSLPNSQPASCLAGFSDPQSWVLKGQQISLSICLRLDDIPLGDQEIEALCNLIATILAQAEFWCQLGFDCRIDSVAPSSPVQRKTFDIRLTLNSHHDLHRDTERAHRATSITDAPVPHGVPLVCLNGISIDLCLSAQTAHPHTTTSSELVPEWSATSMIMDQNTMYDKSMSGLATIVNLLDASLRRLLFGHPVVKVLDVVEVKRPETSSLFQLAPSVFCPDYRESIALRASTASNIACSLSRMSQRAKSGNLGKSRIRNLQEIDQLSHRPSTDEVQDPPKSMESIIEVRLWFLMQDCLLDPRAHESIKPLQLPEDLRELFPFEDQMLEDEDLEMINWPDTAEMWTLENGSVSAEETVKGMISHAEEDDPVPGFECLYNAPSSERMLGYELGGSRFSSPERSFEDLMAVSNESLVMASDLKDMTIDSWGMPCERLLYGAGPDSQAMTSNADSAEMLDKTFSIAGSEEMLDSRFSTAHEEGFAFSDAFKNGDYHAPRGIEMEDTDDILDP